MPVGFSNDFESSPIGEALKARLRQLSHDERGDVCAYWVDVCHYSYTAVAARLEMSLGAVKVCRCRALANHPCGSVRGQCSGAEGCAHERGKHAQYRVVRNIALNAPRVSRQR